MCSPKHTHPLNEPGFDCNTVAVDVFDRKEEKALRGLEEQNHRLVEQRQGMSSARRSIETWEYNSEMKQGIFATGTSRAGGDSGGKTKWRCTTTR